MSDLSYVWGEVPPICHCFSGEEQGFNVEKLRLEGRGPKMEEDPFYYSVIVKPHAGPRHSIYTTRLKLKPIRVMLPERHPVTYEDLT